jgi:hypothetical protein
LICFEVLLSAWCMAVSVLEEAEAAGKWRFSWVEDRRKEFGWQDEKCFGELPMPWMGPTPNRVVVAVWDRETTQQGYAWIVPWGRVACAVVISGCGCFPCLPPSSNSSAFRNRIFFKNRTTGRG